jgi:hypothetical protein
MPDIVLALKALQNIRAENRGGHLYAGVLHLVLLKSKLVHQEYEPVLRMQSEKECQVDLEAYDRFLQGVMSIASEACVHFEKSYPSKAKQLGEIRAQMTKLVPPGKNSEELRKSPWVPAVFEVMMNSPNDIWKCQK